MRLRKLLMLCLFLVGCSSPIKHSNVQPLRNTQQIGANESKVIVERVSSLIASPQDVLILADGQEVCIIPNGQTCEFIIKSGTKKIEIYAKTIVGNVDPTTLQLKFEGGKTYRFIVEPKDMTALLLFGGIGEMIADANNTSEQKGRFRIKLKQD